MRTRLSDPAEYSLVLGDHEIVFNQLIGKPINLEFTGNIVCINCNKSTKKSFNQGYCYPCFLKLAECDMCILKPETCHFDAGTCREPEWGKSYCFQPHIVYLANSSGIKVGITRQTQIPSRWIDQGAIQALPIIRVPSRYVSGLVEVVIGQHISDKTSWQQMLKNHVEPINLAAKRDELLAVCEAELSALSQRFGVNALDYLNDEALVSIRYPVNNYPTKINSFNLDRNPNISGVLHGIKGQYLIMDTGVINIRKYTGYEVEFST